MRIDRRALLRRFGYAWLVASTLVGQRARAQATPPRRPILFYTPGGFFQACWQPAEPWSGDNAGRTIEQPIDAVAFGRSSGGEPRQNVLDVLDDPKYARLKQELIVLDGIDMRAVERSDERHNGIKAALRGRPIQTDDLGPFPNWSVDRVIGANPFPSGMRPLHLKSANLNLGLGNYGYQGAIRDCSEGGPRSSRPASTRCGTCCSRTSCPARAEWRRRPVRRRLRPTPTSGASCCRGSPAGRSRPSSGCWAATSAWRWIGTWRR